MSYADRIGDRIVHAGQEVLNLRGHTFFCQCVTFSPDGRRLPDVLDDVAA
jgi:hypothetical protein